MADMDSQTPLLDSLQEKMSAVLRYLPGAASLFLFGSAASQDSRDVYSDLDLQVVSNDFAASKACLLPFLEQVGPVEAAFLLDSGEDEIAYSVAFARESPYHKVDIGVSGYTSSNDQRPFLSTLDCKVLLWEQQPVTSEGQLGHDLYVPAPGTPAYFLIGELFSAVRYVKSRKRERHLLCWRFLSAKANALLSVLWWVEHGGEIPMRLNTYEISKLDHLLPESDRCDLLRIIDCREPQSMDDALLMLTGQIVERIKPLLQGEDRQAVQMADHYLSFLRRELA